jgi:hypothetical protein
MRAIGILKRVRLPVPHYVSMTIIVALIIIA